MKKIILGCAFILTGIIAQGQGTFGYPTEAGWESFSDSNAPLRVEDFAGGPASFTSCSTVISSSGDNCFAAGELEPFFEIRTANNAALAYASPGALGALQTEPVILIEGVNTGDYLVINFDTSLENVSRVSFDIFADEGFNSDLANVRVFDTAGTLLSSFEVPLVIEDFTFVGIHSTTAIARVEIEDTTEDTPLAITDLRYGVTRANDDGINPTKLTIGEEFDDNDIVSSNVFATDTSVFSGPDVVDPSCASYNGSDVWFRATVPANGAITFETAQESGSNLTDTGMSVITNADGEIACDDDGGTSTFSLIALENLSPGDVLFVRVWAFNGAQNGEFKISAYSEEVLGINDTNATASISHYPNPTKDVINFKATTIITTIELFNVLGQKIVSQSGNSNELTIDLSSQPKGMYIANVVTENGKEAIRIIKE